MKIFGSVWKNIRRSPYQTLAAVSVMTLTFFTVSLVGLSLFVLSNITNYFESRPQVTAFFKNEAKQSEIDSLKSQMESDPNVASVKFVSKEQALQIYKQQNKNDPLLLDLVTADILPSSLEISTKRIQDLSEVSDKLKGSSIVDQVIYQQDVISTLTSYVTAVRRIGIGAVVLFSLFSVLITMVIIGVKVSQKRDDIEIMRLIGAGNWYIRKPFVLEGIFYGFTGTVIGLIASLLLGLYLKSALSSFLHGIPAFTGSTIFVLELFIGEILMAIFLGFLASYIAVLRYLKRS